MIQMTPTDLVEMICEIVNLDSPEYDEHETMHFLDDYDTEDEDNTEDEATTGNMSFAEALQMLLHGWTVARRAWHAERSLSFTKLSDPIYVSDLKANDWYVL